MFPEFLSSDVHNLTEATSIAFAKQITLESISTPLSQSPIPTAYVRSGSGGTPILLLHGFDSSLFEFRRLLPLLAPYNETWAVDLLGFGFTERLSELKFGVEGIKTHLYALWETLIRQPVILVGASMGGAAALDFTLAHPHAVEKLVLLDSAGLAKQPIVGKFMFPPLDFLATEFLRSPKVRQKISEAAYYDKGFATVDAQLCAALHLKCSSWNQALIAFTKSGGYGSFAKRIAEISQPTLIVWGRNDKILGTKDATKFEEAIPDSRLVWIENCGHVPHLEKPQVTANAISEFASREESA